MFSFPIIQVALAYDDTCEACFKSAILRNFLKRRGEVEGGGGKYTSVCLAEEVKGVYTNDIKYMCGKEVVHSHHFIIYWPVVLDVL